MEEIYILIDEEGDVIFAFKSEQRAYEDAEEQNCRVIKLYLND